MMVTLEWLKSVGEAPEWCTDESYKILCGGYLLEDETPKQMYQRISYASAKRLNKPELGEQFFNLFWNNWLGPASPVCSNMGTDRGLPISCLTGDTWVNTETGGKQIKDIEIGDLVLTHEGRYRRVTNKSFRMSENDIYELQVKTRTTKIKITGNHPVLTNLGWIRVDELDRSKHWIAVNKQIETIEEGYIIDLSTHCQYKTKEINGKLYKSQETKETKPSKQLKNGIVSYYASPNRFIEFNEEVAWAIGLWFAEGSRSINNKKMANGIRITVSHKEEEFAKRWIEIFQKYFNLNGNYYLSEVVRNNKKNRWISANINGNIIGEWFSREFGVGCKNKTLPKWLLDSPKSVLKAFLRGVLDGDGSKYKTTSTEKITLANPELLLGIYNICLKLGLAVSMQMESKSGKLSKQRFVYSLNIFESNLLGKQIHKSNIGIQFGKNLYCPIMNLKHIPDHNENVYDITVEDDHSFSVCGVVVHNCFGVCVPDSVNGIMSSMHELGMMSKYGGGVALHYNKVRGRGAKIKGNGYSDGVVPFIKIQDSTTVGISQGGTRRGASAGYLDLDQTDTPEFLKIRKPQGDPNRQCLNIHQAVCITDEFMNKVKEGDLESRKLWLEILKTRFETGEPYIFFSDNVNNQNPESYKNLGFKVIGSNICTEIVLKTDEEHSFVCCLSSMNLSTWEQWKDTNAVQLATWFLDGVMEEFIAKADTIPGFERSVKFAKKSRALGLGCVAKGSKIEVIDTVEINGKNYLLEDDIVVENKTFKVREIINQIKF